MGFLLAPLVSACSNHHHDTALPSTSAPQAPSGPATPSVEDAVRRAYSQYWVALPQAEQATNLDRRLHILADYAAQPLVDQVSGNIDKLHATNLASTGYVVAHIEKVQAGGDEANVWDCQDSTHALLKNSKTGQVASRGTPNDHIRATLIRGSDGRWRVSRFTPLGRC